VVKIESVGALGCAGRFLYLASRIFLNLA